jgi:hypothetical protein
MVICISGMMTAIQANDDFPLMGCDDLASKLRTNTDRILYLCNIKRELSIGSIIDNKLKCSSEIDCSTIETICRMDTSGAGTIPLPKVLGYNCIMVIFRQHIPYQLGRMISDIQELASILPDPSAHIKNYHERKMLSYDRLHVLPFRRGRLVKTGRSLITASHRSDVGN